MQNDPLETAAVTAVSQEPEGSATRPVSSGVQQIGMAQPQKTFQGTRSFMDVRPPLAVSVVDVAPDSLDAPNNVVLTTGNLAAQPPVTEMAEQPRELDPWKEPIRRRIRKQLLGTFKFAVLLVIAFGIGVAGVSYVSGHRSTNQPSASVQIIDKTVPNTSGNGQDPKQKLTINYPTTVTKDLTVDGVTKLQSLQINGPVSIQGSFNVNGTGNFAGSLSAVSFSGDGSNLSNVDATSLGGKPASFYTDLNNLSGTLDISRISPQVAVVNGSNSFTGTNTYSGFSSFSNNTSFSGTNTFSGSTSMASLLLAQPLAVSSGGTGITSVPVGGVLYGQGNNSLAIATAAGAGLCLVSTNTGVAFSTCLNASGIGVASLDGLTNDLTIANSTGNALNGVITINDASTASKGLASFNVTNFTVTSGVVNTIQPIATNSSPTFNGLTLTTSLAVTSGGTGAATAAGARTNLGAAASGANGDITSLAGLTSITPTSTLTVGSTGQTLILQGGAATKLSTTSSGKTTQLAFATPTANHTITLPDAAGLVAISASGNIALDSLGNISFSGTLGVNNGGTGATTTSGARASLGAAASGANSDITSLSGITTALSLIQGGTGATDANGARSNIGAAAKGANNDITGLTGLTTALSVGQGGSGAVTPAGARTNLGAAASGANSDITSISGLTTALSVLQGGTGATSLGTNGVLVGNGTSAITSIVAGSNGLCLLSTASGPAWQACTGAGGVSSVNNQVGALTVTGTTNEILVSTTGTTITLSTSQDIAVTSSPSFAGLALTTALSVTNGGTGSTTASGARTNLGAAGSGANSDITSLSGLATALTVGQGGTGSTAAAGARTNLGAAASGANSDITGLTGLTSINNSSNLTIGNSAKTLTLQGSSTTVSATNGSFTSSLGFASPTANVTYLFQSAAGGTYDVCTTAGNCAGVGGGVTTSGGTAGKLALFSGSSNIGDSLVSQSGSVVTVGGTLAVNTIAPTAALLLGVTTQGTTLQGTTVAIKSTSGANTNTLSFAAPSGSSHTVTLPNANGTVAVSASGPLSIDSAGNVSCPSCVTSGGSGGGSSAVDSIDSLTGAIVLQGTTNQVAVANGSGTITFSLPQDINTSSSPTFSSLTLTSGLAVTSGITAGSLGVTGAATAASFNGLTLTPNTTGFSIAGGTTSKTVTVTASATIDQNIAIASSPTFAGLTLTTALSVANGGTAATTAAGARTNLGAAASGVNSDITSITGLTTALSVAQGGTNATSAAGARTSLSAAASGANADITSLTALTSITPTAALTVGSQTQSLLLQGSATTKLTANDSGKTTQLAFATPTNNHTITLPDAGGTVAVSASGNIVLSAVGDISFTGTLGVGNGGTGATSTAGARTNLGAAASGANSDITSLSGLTTALSVMQGGTGATTLGANGVLIGNGTSAITSIVAGSNGLCLISSASGPIWQACTGAGGVSSVNSATGNLTVAGTNNQVIVTTVGSTITLSAPQDLAVASSPTFAGLSLTTALSVGNGGTGANTLTSKGIVFGNGTGAVQATAAGTSGQIFQADGSGIPSFVTFSNDATVAVGGSVTIATGAVTSGKIADGTIADIDLNTGTFTHITGVGILGTGSIGTGFGTISTGNNITTTVALQGATVNATTGYQVNGAAATGTFLRGNGTNFVTSTIQAGDLPSGSSSYIQNGTTTQTGNFNIQSASASSIGGVIKGAASQTADLLQLQNSSGTVLANFDKSGNLFAQQLAANQGVYSNSFSGATSAVVGVQNTASATSPVALFRGGATPGVGGDLLQLQNSTSTVLAKFDASGNLQVTSSIDRVTSGTLTVGATNATAITLSQSTSLASGKTLTAPFVSTPSLTNASGSLIISADGNLTINGDTGQDSGEGLAFTPTGLQVAGFGGGTSFSVYDPQINHYSGTNAFQVFNSSSISAFNVDTSNSIVTFGNITSTSGNGKAGILKLADGTNDNFGATLNTTTLTTNRTITIPDASGTLCLSIGNCSGAGGAGYIVNGTANQTGNFNIQSAGAASVGGIIKGAVSQTADLLQLQDSSSNLLTNFDAAGNLHIARAATAATNVLTARVSGDTNDRFTIGADGKLSWGTGSVAPATTLSRNGNNFLVASGGLYGTRVAIGSSGTGSSTTLSIQANNASDVGTAISGAPSQTADLLDLQNSSGIVLGGFNASGQLYNLYSTFTGTLAQGALTAARTYTLPDATGTICLQGSASCGFATGSGTAFVQGGNSFGSTATLGTSDNNGLNLSVNGSNFLQVSNKGIAVFSPTTGNDSATAFRVQQANFGATVFNVDTLNRRIGINTVAPGASLQVTVAGGASNIGQIIRGTNSQSGDLQQFQDTSGNTLTKTDANGNLSSYGTANTITGLTYPATVTITNGGTTGSTTYGYRVSAINAQGETITSPTATTATGNAVLSAGNYNIVTFNAVAGATSYKVYGRTSGSELFMATVASTGSASYAYNDTGATTPSGALPAGTIASSLLNLVSGSYSNQALLNVQSSTGSSAASINGFGQLSLRMQASTTTGSASSTVGTGFSGGIGQTIAGALSQTADLSEYQDYQGNVLAGVSAYGNTFSYGTSTKLSNLAAPVITSPSTVGTNYYYMLTATNAAGETVGSNVLALNAVTGVINWTQVPGATGYKLYRNTTNNFTVGSLLRSTFGNGRTVTFTDFASATSAGLPPTTTTGTGLTLQGWSGQSGSVFQVQDQNSNVLTKLNANGDVSIGSANSAVSATALQVSNPTGAQVLTVDTSATRVTVGSTSGCTGRFCINQTLTTNGSTITNQANIITVTGTATSDIVNGQALTITDTSNGTNTLNALSLTTTGTTNTNDTINGLVISNPAANAGNLIKLQSGAANVLTVSNTGATVFANQANSTTAFQILNSSSGVLFNADTLNNTVTTGKLNVNTGSSSNVGLTVQAAASQTADLLQFQNSSGAIQAKITNTGDFVTYSNIYVGSYSGSAGLNIQTASTGSIGQTIHGIAGQTADLLQFQNSSGSVLSRIDSTGNVFAPYLNVSYSAGINSGLATNTAVTISGQPSQSGDLIKLQNSSGTVLSRFDASGNLTIGSANGTPTGQLYVGGNFSSSTTVKYSSLLDATNGKGPRDIAVQGNYTYIVAGVSKNILTYDNTVPTAPVLVNTFSIGGTSTPFRLVMNGRYGYLSDTGSDNVIRVIDFSNPAAPTLVTTVSTSVNGAVGQEGITVQGRYLYVTMKQGAYLEIFDLANPAAPTRVSYYTGGASSGGTTIGDPAVADESVDLIAVQGKYAYVSDYVDDTLQIYDVSNPASPIQKSSTHVTGTYNSFTNIAVQGKYLYSSDNNGWYHVIDISNPSSPNQVQFVNTAVSANTIQIQGHYMYVANYYNNVYVYDISNPTASPVGAGTLPIGTGTNNVQSFRVSGRYAYSVSDGNYNNGTAGTYTVYDLGGAYIQQLEAGGITTSTVNVATDASINGQTTLSGGLTVAGSSSFNGNVGINGNVLLQNSTNSNATFQIQDSSSNAAITVSTNNVSTSATGGNYNTNATLRVAKDSGTGRSINASGTINASGADFAEYYTQAKPGTLKSAQIVCLTATQTVDACGDSGVITGVVSDNAGFVGNDIYDPAHPENTVAVGMLGQLPVQVSIAHGAIKAGDPIGLLAGGVGAKQTTAGQIVGWAMADASMDGSVNVLVRPQHYTPTSVQNMQGGTDGTYANLNVTGQTNLGGLNVSGNTTLQNLTVIGDASIGGSLAVTGTLTVSGQATFGDIIVSGHFITAGNTPIATALAGLGHNALVSIDGNDTSGTITITTGDATTAATGNSPMIKAPSAGEMGSVAFAKLFGKTPRVIITPGDSVSAPLQVYPGQRTTDHFTFGVSATPAPNTTYTFEYFITQ